MRCADCYVAFFGQSFPAGKLQLGANAHMMRIISMSETLE